MKKIVALVLALALALSLCTVAMADTITGTETTSTLTAKNYTLYALSSSAAAAKQNATITSLTKVVRTDDVDEDGVHTVYADKYNLTTADGTVAYYEVAKDCATFKLVDKNDVAVYLTTGNAVKGDKVFTGHADKIDDDDLVCGDVAEGTVGNYTGVEVYTVGTKAYKATGNNWGLYNGKFVKYGEEVTTRVAHDFTDKQLTGTDGKYTAIKCDECGKTFALTKTFDKDWAEGDFKEVTVGTTKYYAVLKTAAAASTTTTVDSSKTFDAGVAMYVGLSLMSVAGSAVVIGKKKEF